MTREELHERLVFERRDTRYAQVEAFCFGVAAGLVLAAIIWSLW